MKNRMTGGIGFVSETRATAPFPEADPAQALLLRVPLPEGAECRVKPGEAVLTGQTLSDGDGKHLAAHSPASGTVKEIGKARVRGTECPAVLIENDGQYTVHPDCVPFEGESEEEQLAFIRSSGIAQEGDVSLASYLERMRGKATQVVLNLVDDEPCGGAYASLFCARGEQILDGMKILLRLLHCREVSLVFGRQAVKAMNEAEKLIVDDPFFRVRSLRPSFPTAFPKVIALAMFGEEEGKKTAVFTPQTALSVWERFAEGLPSVRRFVLVGGDRKKQPVLCQVPIGFPLAALFDREKGDLFDGRGAVTARSATEISVVGKETEGALMLSEGFAGREAYQSAVGHCIGCGRCVPRCPVGLYPDGLWRAWESGQTWRMKELGVGNCLLCGCCEYVCPARLPMRLAFAVEWQRLREEAEEKEQEQKKEEEQGSGSAE